MAKRYHNSGPQTYNAERHEDAEMIGEARNEIANLPQNVMMKTYSSPFTYLPEDYDDTMDGIDEQIRGDQAQRSKHFSPRKV